MGFLDRFRREERSIENPRVSLGSADAWAEVFGSWERRSAAGALVSIDTALAVPAVLAGVSFLSRTLATLPLHGFRSTAKGAERIKGGVDSLVNEAPNPEWTSFQWRQYCFWQTFTGGRQATWIERSAAAQPVALWPLDPSKLTVVRIGGRKFYDYADDGVKKHYEAVDVIDVPFALKQDQVTAISPLMQCRNAIGLAMAMEDYASKFFAGGGVPPLSLEGPLPAGTEAMQRATKDVGRAIDHAKSTSKPYFPIPPGYKFNQVGYKPHESQMTEARRFQIEEIARALQLPPVFLQDLTHGTFSNTEQQDLHLVKHLIAQWAKAFEQELNLKLFGQKRVARYVEHNLDGLQRGDFKSRIEGLARGVQSAILTPDEARALENRQAMPNGDKLYIQGATVPLGSQPLKPATSGDAGNGEADDNGA